MAMTLRLSDEAEAALDQIVADLRLSKNAAVEAAILETAARTSQVQRARAHVARIAARDADMLDRLSRR